MEEIKAVQNEDPRLQKYREQIEAVLRTDVHKNTNGALYFSNIICVPQGEIRQKV